MAARGSRRCCCTVIPARTRPSAAWRPRFRARSSWSALTCAVMTSRRCRRTLPRTRSRPSAMAADVVALMRHLGHERFSVVGHDRGALVAFRTAMDHPDAVQRLVVMDGLPVIEHLERLNEACVRTWWHWATAAPFLPSALSACSIWCPITLQRRAGPATAPQRQHGRPGCPGRPVTGRPGHRDQARSNRSRFMTLSHAATKSRTNFSFASPHA